MKYDIFISYRREGGFEIANLIASKLKSAGYRVFLDLHAIHAGDFSRQLETKVKECKDFIWILSANKESNTICYKKGVDYYRDEICWAIENKSNIIPVKLEDFTFPDTMPDCIVDAIQKYNNKLDVYKLQAIEATKNRFFDAAIVELRSYLISKPVVLYKFCLISISMVATIVALFAFILISNSEEACVMRFIEEECNLPFEGVDIELIIDSRSLGVKHLYNKDEEVVYTGILRRKFNKLAVVKLSGRGFKEVLDTMRLSSDMTIKLERDESYSEYWGYIYDSVTDNPVTGAQVVLGKEFITTTDEKGFFSFSLPVRSQELYKDMNVTKQGYRNFYDSEVYPGESKFHMIRN